ncbi:hypothetical protein DU69_10285 [Methanosarcina mazei]|uniref:Uncharacterized protein n=3 Tax=Methanosarcina mazei TaxID=2209 RepID=A0A0F8G4B7_METMZ|nr:hypothetical protein [Methanosarcina mazei]KKG13616.1 hypothetical protein DU34_13460 [Methanosarcina mazei]KKG26979.1 hypothetical protein DU52_04575 [Methanosarcina mazei]KKG27985.1 hypothetical protein DU49_12945 [Methanosarcina mazei]KKG37366.1 hypothetical protein DU35_16425 [Methanosarcina mazei]KKG46099.1 hypothetical protein DU39_15045 [Methanosarcina mazei]
MCNLKREDGSEKIDEPAFYCCAQNFIDRIGCMSEIECSATKDENYEKKRNLKAKPVIANYFPGTSPLPLFFIERNNLNKEEFSLLKRHWKMFRKNFPVAGILYSNGRPFIFCAKVTDFMNENDFEFLYENIHKSFLYFADKHSLALLQTGQCVMTLCFGFRDAESLETAKKFVEHNGHDMHLFKRTFVETWLIDLNSLEIIQGTGILRKAGQTITENADELLKKNRASNLNGASLSPDALTKPSSFIQYVREFDSRIREGKVRVPECWVERFRPECINLKILSCKKQIQKIETKKEEYERKTGQAVLSRYKNSRYKEDISRQGFSEDRFSKEGSPKESFPIENFSKENSFIDSLSFDGFDKEIEFVLKKQKYLDSIEENISLIKKMRFEWEESLTRVRELHGEFKILDREYKNSCYQLTKTLFEQEMEAVKNDPDLKRIFADMLQTLSEINNRNRKISELQNKKTGFADRVKTETKIIYLKGLNQVDDWNKDKRWVEMGEKVVNSSSSAAHLSSSGKIIKTIEKIKNEKEILNDKHFKEIKVQSRIKENIKSMSDKNEINMSGRSEHSYPWLELEKELTEKALMSKQELSTLFLSLGKSFRKISQKYFSSDLQTLDNELRACESQIMELEYEIDGLKAELRKLTYV